MSTPAAKRRRYVCKGVSCPIYQATEPQCIFCDAIEFSSLRLSFPDHQGCRDYMQQYCYQDYEKCPVYMAFTKE